MGNLKQKIQKKIEEGIYKTQQNVHSESKQQIYNQFYGMLGENNYRSLIDILEGRKTIQQTLKKKVDEKKNECKQNSEETDSNVNGEQRFGNNQFPYFIETQQNNQQNWNQQQQQDQGQEQEQDLEQDLEQGQIQIQRQRQEQEQDLEQGQILRGYRQGQGQVQRQRYELEQDINLLSLKSNDT